MFWRFCKKYMHRVTTLLLHVESAARNRNCKASRVVCTYIFVLILRMTKTHAMQKTPNTPQTNATTCPTKFTSAPSPSDSQPLASSNPSSP